MKTCLRACGGAIRSGSLIALLALLPAWAGAQTAQELELGFQRPPDAARPWVYWFWLNGNITREGITADLEAMQRVGIGGVLIMEVDQGAPVGPIDFMGAKWRALFKHAVDEAGRLGLEVNMNNDAGWNGSGGPWIKPEQAMQKVVWSETTVEGDKHVDAALPAPEVVAGYYRDIAVMAFPSSGDYRINDIKSKACYDVGGAGPAARTRLPPKMVIARERVIDLATQMDAQGRLSWEAPAGKWTVMRIGHTCTGVENAPAPASGRGLECDKLSKEGIEANFAGMMGKLIADAGPAAGKTLVTTHIDSWENGAQNWTGRMREEFRARRGYDLLKYLPVLSGRVIGSLELSERFLWDLRQTVSDLVVENYAAHLGKLAHDRGMRLSIEAYGGPTDDLPYAGRADEPMCEFWIGGGAMHTCKEMASAAHTYGKRIMGAEAFTAGDQEKWLQHPGSIKALGDQAFCDGVNRFVFHRYAMQPWLDPRPGMAMGPWGLHYERTTTWWDWSGPWHTYLSRCQFMLRQGLFVADICYLQPEAAPQGFMRHPRQAYDYDNCSAEVVLTRMSVKDGRIVLPDGMSYRLLVLPDRKVMTPALLRKIRELVEAGATVVGPRPEWSPSLSGYPACDQEVKRLADALWGNCDGKAVTEHTFGRGRIVWGVTPAKVLSGAGIRADFSGAARLRYIHRAVGDADIYFVVNPQPVDVQATCSFRVIGKRPEFWWAESGRIEQAPAYIEKDGATRIPLRLGPSESVFVVFRAAKAGVDPVVSLTRNEKPLWSAGDSGPAITIRKAEYGVPGDAGRMRDVRKTVQGMVDDGELSFEVGDLAQSGDPAFGMVKTLTVEYETGGRSFRVSGQDPDVIYLSGEAPAIIVEKATYGVPGDPKRTRDMKAKVQHMLDTGEATFQVARLARGDDPAYGVVKTFVMEYMVDGQRRKVTGTDRETIDLAAPVAAERAGELRVGADGGVLLEAWKPGEYEARTVAGRTQRLSASDVPEPQSANGPWEVRFPLNAGAPERITLEKLASWSEHAAPGVRYFSGAVTYARSIDVAPGLLARGKRLYLDLGEVYVMADVRLNGKPLGILWHPPYRVDITEVAKAGENALEVRVVNLWPNRLIGDEQLPEDSERNPNGTLKAWPTWLADGKPSPTGRVTFTSWRLWKKDEPLQPSGLLGPVHLRSTVLLRVQE